MMGKRLLAGMMLRYPVATRSTYAEAFSGSPVSTKLNLPYLLGISPAIDAISQRKKKKVLSQFESCRVTPTSTRWTTDIQHQEMCEFVKSFDLEFLIT
ncbi:hypothetical protein J6590_073644 [Homalodisca vitripennis]|nr:hypothetical protein J6590_073644 [Homalodisca vitripennis]